MNGENPRLNNPFQPRNVQRILLSASTTQHMWELLAGGTAQQFYHNMRGEGGSRVTSKARGTHTLPTTWPFPHACAQLCHKGSGNHGQLFRPYWGSSTWYRRRSVTGGNPFIRLFLEMLSVKLCTRQSRKVIWDMFNTLFLKL